ncbi:MAG: PEP-CTERM sorting domain-containing protein [Proteobacteria bacterium]|nr:PEP-CTERM sorting domain-containing protein [Pseudomonadota bacterium]
MKVLINWLRMASSATLLMLLTVQSAWAGAPPPPGGGDVITVPEPGTLGLLALGIAGIALARRKKK